MTKNQPAIDVRNVTLWRQDLLVLDQIDLQVQSGSFLAIIGPNGGGKSTLVKAILGVLRPTRGEIFVLGRPAHDLGPLRCKLGYVPQLLQIDHFFPVSVYDVVLMGRFGRVGAGRKVRPEDRQAALAALERMGIAHLQDRPIGRLSGGQRQRALLARALCNQPEILFLDEPTTGVDAESSAALYSLLRQLKEEGVTIVLVSHDIGVAATFVDSIACLNVRLVAHARPDELETTDALREMYGCDVAYLHHGHAPHIVVEDHT